MSDQPFNNNSDQQTRREVLKDTYLSRAQADAEIEAQGRFKKQNPTTVTGVHQQYPRQPSNSPWATPDPTGPEPPFPFDIEFVGELGGESPAPVSATVETANATSDGGPALPPKGRGSLASSSVSARSFRRVW
jgi:hypothetical protein